MLSNPKSLFCRQFDLTQPTLSGLWSRRSRVESRRSPLTKPHNKANPSHEQHPQHPRWQQSGNTPVAHPQRPAPSLPILTACPPPHQHRNQAPAQTSRATGRRGAATSYTSGSAQSHPASRPTPSPAPDFHAHPRNPVRADRARPATRSLPRLGRIIGTPHPRRLHPPRAPRDRPRMAHRPCRLVAATGATPPAHTQLTPSTRRVGARGCRSRCPTESEPLWTASTIRRWTGSSPSIWASTWANARVHEAARKTRPIDTPRCGRDRSARRLVARLAAVPVG